MKILSQGTFSKMLGLLFLTGLILLVLMNLSDSLWNIYLVTTKHKAWSAVALTALVTLYVIITEGE